MCTEPDPLSEKESEREWDSEEAKERKKYLADKHYVERKKTPYK